jgi:hypothetical protein
MKYILKPEWFFSLHCHGNESPRKYTGIATAIKPSNGLSIPFRGGGFE